MIATLRFDLSDPDDAREHRYAMAGRDALVAMDRIEQALRSKLKYSELGVEARGALEEIRALIPYELTALLD
jgi:hypothetical protein